MWKSHCCHFTKKILTKGEGFSCPSEESKCHVQVKEIPNFQGSAENFKAVVLDISELTVGWPMNGVMKLLELLIITMKKGEISQFDVSTSFQLGTCLNNTANTSQEDLISVCTIIMELVDFDDVEPVWKRNDEDKFEIALCHKNEGSKLFQESNLQAAFFHYSLSTKYLISLSTSSENWFEVNSNEYHKLMCICFLNLAACQLKFKNYQSVIANCTKALNVDGKNVKALYRRATAYKELGRNNEAKSDLLRAKKHEPRNRVIHDLLQSLSEIKS